MKGIRYRLVLKYTGGTFLVLAAAFLASAGASIVLGERFFIHYAVPGISIALAGWYLTRLVPEKELTVPEVAAVASLSFLSSSLMGAVPFSLIAAMTPIDAWFEAMSAVTTTGFSLLDVESAPRSLLFMRALFQWLGGLGFVVITVSLVIIAGGPAVALLKAQVEQGGKLFPRIAQHVRVIAATYVSLTLLGVLALSIAGLDLFEAICYTFSGISTGGFAIHTGSVGGLGPKAAPLVLIVIMALGAVNFVLYYRALTMHKGFSRAVREFIKNPQVLGLIIFTITVGLLLGLSVEGEGGWMNGFFLAASAQTGTGYYILAPASLPAHAMLLVVLAMIVGGSMGSTSGGIKLFRVIEIFKGLHRFLITRHYPEEAVLPGTIAGKGVAKEALLGIFYVITVYGLFIFLGTLAFVANGYEALPSLFEVTSAAATVGLSSGLVSPELPVELKGLLIFGMWAGRLEFIPILVWAYSLRIR